MLVPEWTFSIAGTYRRDIGFGELLLRADYAWQDDAALWNGDVVPSGNALQDSVNAALVDAVVRKAGGEANARVGLTMMDDTVEIALFGRNIFDRRVNRNALIFAAPLNIASTQRNDPVTYGVTATFKFGS